VRGSFCISRQRTGTTSVGTFLRDHGFRVAGYGAHSIEWSRYVNEGNYEAIFRARRFVTHNAFEDIPWWYNDFYRFLSFRFPRARFILLERDSEQWFQSMVSHPHIPRKAGTYEYCRQYRNLDYFYRTIDASEAGAQSGAAFPSIHELKDRYISVYEEYNREVIEHFQKIGPERLFHARLEDTDKWVRLGRFLDIAVTEDYEAHSNKTWPAAGSVDSPLR
jgi:hypothetical protein